MGICVVGGGGRAGLPLSIALAHELLKLPENDPARARLGREVVVHDINALAVDRINRGEMPFKEKGAPEILEKVRGKSLRASLDPASIAKANIVIVIIGTPVDEFLNPSYKSFVQFFEDTKKYFRDGQTLILRSTVYPGASQKVQRFFDEHGIKVSVAFCPERIAEGKAMDELYSLPQIISAFGSAGLKDSRTLFQLLAKEMIEVTPFEAELAKLFCNSWRYIQFATANQYYMVAESLGVDFFKVHQAMTQNYPRTQDFPKAGFAGGPCLFKDTMQLSALASNNYFIGHAAMLVNEGLPQFVIDQAEKRYGSLADRTVGVLGMAFKGESDDPRASLSYKLKKTLEFRAHRVLCTDEYISDESFVSLSEVLEKSDILFLATPHRAYRDIRTTKPVVDVWNWIPRGESPIVQKGPRP